MLIPVWFSSLAGKLRLVQPLFSHRYGKAHPREMIVVRFDVDVKCRSHIWDKTDQISQDLTYENKPGSHICHNAGSHL